jgi:hypothetical protein
MSAINIDEMANIKVERRDIDLIWLIAGHDNNVTGTIKIGYEAFPELMYAIQDTMDRVSFVQHKIDAKDFNALAVGVAWLARGEGGWINQHGGSRRRPAEHLDTSVIT